MGLVGWWKLEGLEGGMGVSGWKVKGGGEVDRRRLMMGGVMLLG